MRPCAAKVDKYTRTVARFPEDKYIEKNLISY
jgi:hypothetical protein